MTKNAWEHRYYGDAPEPFTFGQSTAWAAGYNDAVETIRAEREGRRTGSSLIDEIDADPVSRRELDKARGWLIGKAEAARDIRAARDHFQRVTGATDTDILVRVYNDAIRIVEEGWTAE